MPLRVSRHTDHIVVGRRVARLTAQAGHAESVRAASDGRLVGKCLEPLEGPVSCGMAVHTARVLQHLARFAEEGDRALGGIGDPRECAQRSQSAASLRAGRARYWPDAQADGAQRESQSGRP